MMRKLKYLGVLAAVVLVMGGLAACSSSDNEKTTSQSETEGAYQSSGEEQLAEPKAGDTIATMHVQNYGDITIRLFPKAAPKAVENFITHAKAGYYDGVVFHRVINDFMIQGGDPTGTGRGGESIWEKSFEDEFAENLMPVRGALCMANAGANTNGSQFFIVQAKEANVDTASTSLTDEQRKMFRENGGTPHLVYAHTVFGQVVEGMDVVDQIAACRTDASDRPVTDVVITSIAITEQQ